MDSQPVNLRYSRRDVLQLFPPHSLFIPRKMIHMHIRSGSARFAIKPTVYGNQAPLLGRCEQDSRPARTNSQIIAFNLFSIRRLCYRMRHISKAILIYAYLFRHNPSCYAVDCSWCAMLDKRSRNAPKRTKDNRPILFANTASDKVMNRKRLNNPYARLMVSTHVQAALLYSIQNRSIIKGNFLFCK